MSRITPILIRFVILLFASSFVLNSIANKTDSLKRILSFSHNDTATINMLNRYTSELIVQNNPEANIFLQKLLKLSDSLKYEKGQADVNYNYFTYFKMIGNYPDALLCVQKSLAFYEKINDYRGQVICYKGMGVIYGFDRKYDKSLLYLETALNLSLSQVKSEIGDSYNSLGWLTSGLNQFDKALDYYKKSIKYHKEFNNEIGLGKAYTNMGIICRKKKDTKTGIQYLDEAKSYFEKNNLTWGLILVYINKGICLSIDGNYDEAIRTQKLALDLATKAGDKENLANAYFGLYESYKSMGDYRQALKNYERLTQIKDTVFDEESKRKLAELQAKYENEKKENEIKLLKQENQINELEISHNKQRIFISYGIIIIVVIGSGMGYLYYRNRQKQQLKEAVLNTEIAERTRIAKDMHDELGSSLTKILVVSEVAKSNLGKQQLVNENINTINTTVKDLSSNIRDFVWTLNPENATLENLTVKLREFCSDMFDEAQIEIDLLIQDDIPEIELSKKAQRSIYLACKESINNIIKHANTAKALFSLHLANEKLKISICDYGKGFDIETLKTSGHGLKNIIKRIEDIKGTAKIESNPGSGTSINFEIDIKCLS
jgi:signal transduction histidine kinase